MGVAFRPVLIVTMVRGSLGLARFQLVQCRLIERLYRS